MNLQIEVHEPHELRDLMYVYTPKPKSRTVSPVPKSRTVTPIPGNSGTDLLSPISTGHTTHHGQSLFKLYGKGQTAHAQPTEMQV